MTRNTRTKKPPLKSISVPTPSYNRLRRYAAEKKWSIATAIKEVIDTLPQQTESEQGDRK